ncbi:TonB-dependent receptor domain-containing protein [Burkholderia singularis]|uniref:TonB-dependent receptor Outer membrane receptor for ferrienterochelin and colicins n=1 Tax=Burkholderia singularis TaxID=1503053 RepID=A0A238HBP2_9BURK|nr:TonB-dependent receptor [Burkholderia singularis]SMG02709.1 TonB-dependent receptor; Outer membrane receptor for ferrienterochelin and colicins [Burkholderia singularis]
MSSHFSDFVLKPAVVAGLSMVGASAGWAQQAPASAPVESGVALKTIVVTASQREQAIKDAPASISVITREDIAAKPYTSVAEIVSKVEGVSVVGSSPDDMDISIRGMPGEYTLILVDGRRQSTRETMNRGTGGVQGNLLPPLSAIERIEVVRGPMSSLYGADAMGGVINVITRKVPKRWGGTVTAGSVFQLESNQGDTQSADFWIGGPLKNDVLGLQVSGRALHRGEDRIYFPLSRADGASGQRIANFDVKLNAKPASNQDISLNVGREQLSYLSTPGKSTAPVSAGDVASTVVETRHVRDYWGITHNGRWGFGNSTLSLYGERGTQSQWTALAPSAVKPTLTDTVLEGKVEVPWWGERNILTAGAQHIWSRLSGAGRQDAVPKGYGVNSDSVSRNAWAIFAENDYFFNSRFTLTTGVRLDHDERYGSHVSPRAYGVYKLSPALTLRGGVSAGFKPPTLRQSTAGYCMTSGGAAGAVPGTLCGNPGLKPETSLTEELGIRYDRGESHASITLFNNLFKNKVASYDTGVADPRSPGRNIYTYDNVERVKLYGVELGAGARVAKQLKISGAYTFTQSRREGSGEKAFDGSSLNGFPLDKTPKHMFNVQVDWTPAPRLDLYANVNYTGSQYWAAFRNGARGVRERPSTTTFDIGGRYRIDKHFSVNFALLNLTNKMVPVDDRARANGLSGNWLFDQGRRVAVSLTAEM